MTELTRIAVHGVPRSGTSWVGEILNSSPVTVYKFQPLFAYAFKGCLQSDSSRADIEAFFEALAEREDDFLDQVAQRDAGDLPRFEKQSPTHLVYKEVRYHHLLEHMLASVEDLRLVAVVRNPLSVIASWVSAPREFRHDQGWKLAEEWRDAPRKNQGRSEEFFGYNRWREVTEMFQRLASTYHDRVCLLEYESLVSQTREEVARLFDFCDLAITPQTEQFVQRSTQTEVAGHYSVFRAVTNAEKWREVLEPEIAEAIINQTRSAGLEHYLHANKGAA